MEKFKVTLKEDAQGIILEAKEIIISINSTYPVMGSAGAAGNLDSSNLQINAKLISILRDGTAQTSPMPTLSIIGDELDKLILDMPDGPEKVKVQAKLANFDKCTTAIRAAITQLMKAQYVLENTAA